MKNPRGIKPVINKLKNVANKLKITKKKEIIEEYEDHRIHAEFADFTSNEFFRLFEKYVVRGSNSLGMNEQELSMLLDYWKGNTINIQKSSKPNPMEILALT